MLKIENLNVFYGGIHALRGINLEVPDKKIISLIGANGAGKSTTLKSIMNLVSKSEGSVEFNGKDITNAQTKDIVAPRAAEFSLTSPLLRILPWALI